MASYLVLNMVFLEPLGEKKVLGADYSYTLGKVTRHLRRGIFAFFSRDREKRNGWFMLTPKPASETFGVINVLQRRAQHEEGSKSASETETLKALTIFIATGQ